MATSITIIKRMSYRGDTSEEWSNRYFLDGPDPTSSTEWMDIFTPLATAEKDLYLSDHAIVGAYGYTDDADSAASVWSRDLRASGSIAGSFAPGAGSIKTPGDAAFTVRWKTSRLNSKGKPIYLRKYYHGALAQSANPDLLMATQVTAANAFATMLWDGAGIDGRHIRGPGQSADTIVGSACNVYVTTRTLKRRGRRPTTA